MEFLFFGGIVVFFVGLVMSHIVVAVTRTGVRKKEPMKVKHRVMMWTAVGLVVVGLGAAATGYLLNN